MKPECHKDGQANFQCKMNTKDKNLWIVGTKEQCENFLKLALGKNKYNDENCYDSLRVYNKDDTNYWDGYEGQPFIIFRNYNKQKRALKVREMRLAGEWGHQTINIRWSSGMLDPDLYHCIVLSNYTPEEYCKGMDHYDDEVGGLKWRYDILQLRQASK